LPLARKQDFHKRVNLFIATKRFNIKERINVDGNYSFKNLISWLKPSIASFEI
jgi:hypothetical protein